MSARRCFAHFLGIPAPEEFLQRVSGRSHGDRTNVCSVPCSCARARRRPVILVVENVHWIDASSEEFLRSWRHDVLGHRVLLCSATRPGGTPDWLPPRDADDRARRRSMPETCAR